MARHFAQNLGVSTSASQLGNGRRGDDWVEDAVHEESDSWSNTVGEPTPKAEMLTRRRSRRADKRSPKGVAC
jgi:hypothetical protein